MDAPSIEILAIPVLLWAGTGVGLGFAFARSTSTVLLRLAATFLALWSVLATTALVWVVASGGWGALEGLLNAPPYLSTSQAAAVCLWGALGAFIVFSAAFLLNQLVGRSFRGLLRPKPLAWPASWAPPPPTMSLGSFEGAELGAFSFTILEAGGPRLLRRREEILLSSALLAALTPPEVEAVIAHELGHVRRLDARYLTFFRTLSRLMRWDPVLEVLANSVTRREEFRADADAIAITGRPLALARALFKASTAPSPSRRGSAAFLGVGGRAGRRDALERIRRLVALADSGQYPEEPSA